MKTTQKTGHQDDAGWFPSDPKGFLNLPGLLVHGVFVAEGTEFLVIHPLRVFPFILGGVVIPLLANFTG
jgi:hypothetical protein